ncbi:MAG: helix-turn-helix domain-containing protein [Chloroflexota bacterium]
MQRPTAAVITQRTTLARLCRDGRLALGWSQATLASRVGVSRSYITGIERSRANPTLDTIVRLATVLGFEIDLMARAAIVVGDRRQRDAVHAWCSGYTDRRLVGGSWETAREVELIDGRWRGWIDLLAFDPRTGTLLVIEIKTRIDDVGAIERQVGWYARAARQVARARGWDVRRVEVWLLVLASAEIDASILANRDALQRAFPGRAPDLAALLDGTRSALDGLHGIAAIDPGRRRRAWLLPTRVDGRRGAVPYRDYRDAAERHARPGSRRPPRPPRPGRATVSTHPGMNTRATTGESHDLGMSPARSSPG